MRYTKLLTTIASLTLCLPTHAVEVKQLTEDNWADYIPAGKEIDAIYGDYVIRNEVLTAIIAQPTPTRNANLTIREVGGCVIDLTRHDSNNDQLGCFYPTGNYFSFTNPTDVDIVISADENATLQLTSQKKSDGSFAKLIYSLNKDGQSLRIITEYINGSEKAVNLNLQDSIRADSPFVLGSQKNTFWANDQWFRQAYGVWTAKHQIKRTGGGGRLIQFSENDKTSFEIQPLQHLTFERRLIPAGSLLELNTIFNDLSNIEQHPVELSITDADGPISHTYIHIKQGDTTIGDIRTDHDGNCKFSLPAGDYTLGCHAAGRPPRVLSLSIKGPTQKTLELKQAGYISAHITDGSGKPIYAKLSFQGLRDTATPNFAPKQNAVFAENLIYANHGKVHHPLFPGSYRVIISHGPEYNADVQEIVIQEGETTTIRSALEQVIDTHGWISADFHT
ncbi:MAG: hypothetical protein VX776_05360, partial [Planctomycetota bacterium]|nr:hypothetical protein [Planctomycetota bacterium]